jgi:DNA polymerase IV
MDCFFAAVEMRDHPELAERPIAVGGAQCQRGVISTCNYKAREYGVRSAMATATAMKLCPDLVLLPGRMSVYKEVSEQIRAIFRRYTQVIEPLSLDEAYLDVTDSGMCHGSATLIAQAIRSDIENELNLTASAGAAPIKFLAKVASDINKPNGQCVVTPEQMQSFIDQLPLEKIPGVGKVACVKLQKAGLFNCRDVRESNYRNLLIQFGRLGASLWKKSQGIDDREVVTYRERKSVGVEVTLEHNIQSFEDCWVIIENQLYPKLIKRLHDLKTSRHVIKIGMKVKFADFQLTTIEHSDKRLEVNQFRFLLSEILTRQNGREIRLIGLNVALQPGYQTRQMSFF